MDDNYNYPGGFDDSGNCATMSTPISLFVPGRLCLAGEHSDWAASYRLQSPSIAPGAALVVGLQQGLRATASRIESDLDVSSSLAGSFSISPCDLLTVSRSKNPWRLSAAVGFIIRQRYGVTGLSLNVTGQTLPAGKGLSSSAAVCVLTARAFNVLYRLHLTTSGEMEVAYAAERLTGSPCGRMDQVVAAGPGRIARMKFDGDFVEHRVLEVPDGRPIYIVLADLGMQKDTKAILTGLHRAYPDGDSLDCKTLQDALGATNLELIAEMEEAITQSKLERLGQLFMYAQKVFDDAGIPFCPDELRSPALHKILKDRDLQRYSYGGKGVGSQGDGSVQFVAKDHESATMLTRLLREKLRTEPYIVSIAHVGAERKETNAIQTFREIPLRPLVHTAVIPAAGFGTRLYPASRSICPKALFPIIDDDGFAKPLLLHLVEQCARAGILRVIIVTGPGAQKERVEEVFAPISAALDNALKPAMREYAKEITKLSSMVEIAVQEKPLGFGHAVACATVEVDCPFALLLGDVALKSSLQEKSCLMQAISEFESNPSRSVIGVTQVPVSEAVSYGVVGTAEADFGLSTRVPIQEIIEKPSMAKAEELGQDGKCSIILGPYILTPSVMKELRKDVEADRTTGGEIQLTPALEKVWQTEGMDSYCLRGEALDTGNAAEYVRTLTKLASLNM